MMATLNSYQGFFGPYHTQTLIMTTVLAEALCTAGNRVLGKRLLERAIDRLRPPLRNVIEIQRSHCISVREIAEVAGISVAATKSRLLRARTALRRSLRASP